MAVLRKRKLWIVSVAFVVLVLLMCAGVAIWADPPIVYYGQWMWQHELRERHINPISCVQLHINDWYLRMAQIFPAPSSFICFNTDSEARLWIQQNIP